MSLFLLAMGLAGLVCLVMWLMYGGKCYMPQDELYNQIVLDAIQLKDEDISLDEVMESLSSEDMTGFHLSCHHMGS